MQPNLKESAQSAEKDYSEGRYVERLRRDVLDKSRKLWAAIQEDRDWVDQNFEPRHLELVRSVNCRFTRGEDGRLLREKPVAIPSAI
jgi:hypothetical protein